jgi:hypothetical protein
MDHRQDLIDRLCTIAGMIFEDASATAILRSSDEDGPLDRIERIRRAAADAGKLAEAALVVHQFDGS